MNDTHPVIGGIHLHHELSAGIRDCEDGGAGELGFELLEGLLSLGGPLERDLWWCESMERCSCGAEVSDKPKKTNTK